MLYSKKKTTGGHLCFCRVFTPTASTTTDRTRSRAWRRTPKPRAWTPLGFSGHSPLPFANDWAIDQSCLADYLREARSLQADFRGRFSLYCGLEWDSCSPLPEQKLDYLIGSVHYFPALPDGTRFTVDGSAQLLAQCAQVQFGGDMAAQADCYYALVARLAEVPQVDIVGHFDLITKFDEPAHALSHRPAQRTRRDGSG